MLARSSLDPLRASSTTTWVGSKYVNLVNQIARLPSVEGASERHGEKWMQVEDGCDHHPGQKFLCLGRQIEREASLQHAHVSLLSLSHPLGKVLMNRTSRQHWEIITVLEERGVYADRHVASLSSLPSYIAQEDRHPASFTTLNFLLILTMGLCISSCFARAIWQPLLGCAKDRGGLEDWIHFHGSIC